MKYLHIPFIIAFSSLSSQAVIVTITDTTATANGEFSDGGGDFFGVISGGQIAGASFSFTSVSAPPEGAVAGRDHDDGNSRPELVTAVWELVLPGDAAGGTGFTNISFNGMLAASPLWDNIAGDNDFIDFELLLNGAVVETLSYHPNVAINGIDGALALDTNNDGVGDGTTVSTTGIAVNLSNAGGAAINSVTLRGTYRTDSSNEQHWSTGTLSADYDQIPEPSSTLLLGICLALGVTRRSR